MEFLKISVLVPIYNYDISLLLNKLIKEIEKNELLNMIEIIMVDDASTDLALKLKNRTLVESLKGRMSKYEIQNKEWIIYEELQKNLGRASIRNYLVDKSSGEFVLFLDSDVLPDTEDFLATYYSQAQQDLYHIVCGGISYKSRIMNDKIFDKYYYISKHREQVGSCIRNNNPWRYLFTSNIMVKKSVIIQNGFNERFIGYGFEDTEWGIRLSGKYKILHVDNTASHLGLKTSEEYYNNMIESTPNLKLILDAYPKEFGKFPLSRWYNIFMKLNLGLLKILKDLLKMGYNIDFVPYWVNMISYQLSRPIYLAVYNMNKSGRK